MKKLDEMDRKIRLCSEEIAYRFIILVMSIWTIYNCMQTIVKGAEYNILPGLIVCGAVSVQSFSQMYIKQKMIDGDEEYIQPNNFLWSVVWCLVISAILRLLGTYFLVKV